MTPERFIELWRRRFGDAPIPGELAEYILLDPPSRNRFAHRDTRTEKAKLECEQCGMNTGTPCIEEDVCREQAATKIPQEFDHGQAICICSHKKYQHGNPDCMGRCKVASCICREFEREQDYDDPPGSDDLDHEL